MQGHWGYKLHSLFAGALPQRPGGPNLSGALDFFHTFDAFSPAGGQFSGLQGGYNYRFAPHVVIGVEADVSFPDFSCQPNFLVEAFRRRELR
jgi:hypothetical protein